MKSILGLFLTCSLSISFVTSLPIVDKGVFVITGVKTCRQGAGYCVLGGDCSVDKEFAPDDLNGHCDGLRKAFTPRAYFVCCQYNDTSTTLAPVSSTVPTTTTPATPTTESNESISEESTESAESVESSEVSSNSSVTESGAAASTTITESSTVIPITNKLDIMSSITRRPAGGMRTSTISRQEEIATSRIPSVEPVNTSPQSPTAYTTSSTTVTYEDIKTEISIEQTVSLHLGNFSQASSSAAGEGIQQERCGYKLNSIRTDSSRLAAQQTSTTCWTGAIVRSPTSLTLQDPGSFICTGALISNNILLTTATCVSRLFAQDLSLFRVALGSKHLLHPMHGPTPDATYHEIQELVIHENYAVDGHLRRSDIALVRLMDKADMSQVCTICLPEADEDHSGEDCIVTGYSHPPSDSSALETDGILHEADQRIEFQPNCESVLVNANSTNGVAGNFRGGIASSSSSSTLDGLICASGKYSAEACFSPRDAGSPLACQKTSKTATYFTLMGVFSSGFHCGTPDMPVLYTDITKQRDWIMKNLLPSNY